MLAIKSEVERSLRLSEDFNVCLEAIYRAVERFNKRCVPLTLSQIIRLKALHRKIWGYSVVLGASARDPQPLKP